MSDKNFAARLQSIMNESPNMLSFGKQLTPVVQASWPSNTPENTEVDSSTNEVPSSTQSVVTNGDTTKLGEPRTDLQQQTGTVNQEVMSEISSLLVSIGYILSKESIVPDKFDVCAVLKFLNDKFKDVKVPQPTEQTIAVDAVAIEPPESQEDEGMEFKPQAFLEGRKLLESKFKK